MALGEWDNAPTIHASLPDVRLRTIEEPKPTHDQVWAAAFRQENSAVSLGSSHLGHPDQYEIDDGFDTLNYVREKFGAQFEMDHGDRFIDVFNRPYADALKAQIDMEVEDDKTLAAAGADGEFARLVAAISDPLNFIPVGRALRIGKSAHGLRAGLIAGRTGHVASPLGRTIVAGGVGATLSEGALQASQETRTPEESAVTIGGSVFLSGILGMTVGAALSRAERRALAAGMQNDIYAPVRPEEMHDLGADLSEWIERTRSMPAAGAPPLDAASVGAAATSRQTIDDLTIAGGAARRTAEETAWLNPGLRLFTSPSPVARGIAENLGEWTLYLKKNFGPNARPTEQAVETLVERYMGGVATVTHKINGELYPTYRKAGGTMNREAFNREVGKAMRRNDQSPIPEIAAAAREYRERVVRPVLERAIEVGLLPKNVSVGTAATYFPRVWNRVRLEAEEGQFKSIASNWMGGELDRVVEIKRQQLARIERNIRSEIDDLEMAALRRDEELRRREAGDEIDIDGFNDAEGATVSEGDVLRMIRTVRTSATPRVETLKDWVVRQGGLYDPGGDVARLEYRRPGFLKKSRRTPHAVAGDQGGIGLDDAAQAAWDDGFFPGHIERPTPREFLEALADDVAGNPIVREADFEAARVIRERRAVEDVLARMGVDLGHPRFATTEAMRDVLAKVNSALRNADQARIATLNRKLADAKAAHDFDVEAFTGAERGTTVQEAVDAVFDRLTGRFGDTMPALRNVVPVKRGPLAERSFGIPDEMIEQWLENDVDLVMQRHARIGGAEVELAGKFGSADMRDTLAELLADYRGQRAAIEADGSLSPEQRASSLATLSKRERADQRDIEALRDMLRGSYGAEYESKPWARALNAMNILNYMAALGGVVASSMTEPFRLMILHGVGRTMRQGIAPMVTNLKGMKLSRADARLAGALIERDLATHLGTWSELMDPHAARSPAERFLEKSARFFSKWGNGIVFWTDFLKSIDAGVAQSRIINGARSWSNLDDAERAFLLQLGIDATRARHIAEQFSKHGEMEGDIPVANLSRWDDTPQGRVAFRSFSAALTKDVKTGVVTPGKADKPLFTAHPLGRAVMQFQSYGMAAHQRVFLRTLQGLEMGVDGGRAGAAAGIAAMISMGMMIYFFKAIEANREISDNPGTWLAEGLDRSGLFTIFFAANNAVEKNLNAGAYGALASLFPGDQQNLASRYANRSPLSSMAGPSAGYLEKVVQMLAAARKGDLTAGDVNAAIRLTPVATLPAVRTLMEYHVKPALHDAVAD